MKQVQAEDMEFNKNYLAIITVSGEEFYHTVAFCEKVGFCEYIPPVECRLCNTDSGDEWTDANWMFNNDLKIFDLTQ